MKVVTGEQMKALDQKAIKGLGIPGVILMEHAGRIVVEEMACRWDTLDEQRIAICCGAGNNGGDGFVVARHLMNRGLLPEVFLFADIDKVRGDARINLDVLLNMGGRMYVVSDQDSMEVHGEILKGCDIIVDAIFGTGLKPPVQGFLAEVIRFINGLHKQVVAVDIPSGLGSDSPRVEGPCIEADLTVTFALPKVSQLLPPAMGLIGTLKVADIGIPPFLIDEALCAMTALDRPFLAPLVRRRSPDSHKGTYGHCLVIAGSEGKTGAAYLAAQGGLRIGAGLVSLALPRSLNDIMEVKLTEAMTIPLPETAGRTIAPEAWDALSQHISKFSAIVIGPGLSQDPGTGEFVRTLMGKTAVPLVIDADALNLIAGRLDLVKQSGLAPILTPHPGEMARLTGSTVSEVLDGRPEIIRKEAERGACHLLLKGYQSLMATPDGELFVNTTGNPGMASGGTGDVLSGMIGGLLAQGYARRDAMLLGVYLHGLAGDIAAAIKGEEGLIATDLLDAIPEAFESLKEPPDEVFPEE